MTSSSDILVNKRDRGLVRALGPFGLMANVVNYTIGASIFVMPASSATLAGAWAPLAYVVAALATVAITLCYAEAGARVPTSGGQAGFTEVAFGRFAGFLAGALTYIANLLAAGAITAAAVDMLAANVAAAGLPSVRLLLISCWATMLFLTIGGKVRRASRFVSVATAIKLVPLALLLGVGLLIGRPGNLQPPHLPLPTGFGQATLLAIFLFAGVHGALLAGGEIRDPARSVPRALLAGMGVVIVIFIGCQLAAQGILGDRLAASHAPLADAMSVASPMLGSIMTVGALVSMLGWTASDALSTPRSLYALGQDGFLPRRIGTLDPTTLAPRSAIALHLLLVVVLAASGTFAALAAVCALVLVVLMIGACAAALRLRHRNIALDGAVRPLPGLYVAAATGTLTALGVGTQADAGQVGGTAAILGALSLLYAMTATRRAAVKRAAASGQAAVSG